MIRIEPRNDNEYGWLILETEEDINQITENDYNIAVHEKICDKVDLSMYPQYMYTSVFIYKDAKSFAKSVLSGHVWGTTKDSYDFHSKEYLTQEAEFLLNKEKEAPLTKEGKILLNNILEELKWIIIKPLEWIKTLLRKK